MSAGREPAVPVEKGSNMMVVSEFHLSMRLRPVSLALLSWLDALRGGWCCLCSHCSMRCVAGAAGFVFMTRCAGCRVALALRAWLDALGVRWRWFRSRDSMSCVAGGAHL